MTTWIALLRGINVGGHKRVAMADLRDFLGSLGFEHPRTLLQSGNAVFGAATRSGVALERRLEEEAPKALGLETAFFVRDAKEWKAVVAQNPFGNEAEGDPARLLVVFLRNEPAAKAVKDLDAAIKGRERVRVRGRHAYIYYPDGAGRSRLTNAVLERHLGTGTARNWNTVLKLAALVE